MSNATERTCFVFCSHKLFFYKSHWLATRKSIKHFRIFIFVSKSLRQHLSNLKKEPEPYMRHFVTNLWCFLTFTRSRCYVLLCCRYYSKVCLPSLALSSGSTELLRSGKWTSDFFLVVVPPPLLPRLQRSDRKERSQIRFFSGTWNKGVKTILWKSGFTFFDNKL